MATNRFAVVVLASNKVEGVYVGEPVVPSTKLVLEVMEGELVGPEFSYRAGEVPRFVAPPDEVPPEEPAE